MQPPSLPTRVVYDRIEASGIRFQQDFYKHTGVEVDGPDRSRITNRFEPLYGRRLFVDDTPVAQVETLSVPGGGFEFLVTWLGHGLNPELGVPDLTFKGINRFPGRWTGVDPLVA